MEFEKAHTIAKKMTYFELSVTHDFMNEFIAGLFLPHTNRELFPTVSAPGPLRKSGKRKSKST